MPTNQFDQPIGPSLGNWRPPPVPAPIPLNGRTVRLEPLDPTTHAAPLFEAFVDAPDSLWTYLQHGPFATADELGEALSTLCDSAERLPFAVVVFLMQQRREREDIGILDMAAVFAQVQRDVVAPDRSCLRHRLPPGGMEMR